MKTKINMLCALSLMVSLGVAAQTQYDAERLIGTELNGTARFVGMGGAMSALGGDLTVMGTNPAGIGIYRSNDISASFGFNNTSAKADFNGKIFKDNRTRMSMDQIGFVYSNKYGNSTSLKYVNFGFNYRKSKNFNRLFASGGNLEAASQTWQMSNMLGLALDYYDIPISETDQALTNINDAENPYLEGNKYPYLGIMGVRTNLIGVDSDNNLIGWNSDFHNYTSREEGGINEYDFNVAFNVDDRYYFGATVGAYDVNYKRTSFYKEHIYYYNDIGSYNLTNWFETKGSGIDLKLGFIFRPFEYSPLRLGFAIHTPTWYNLTDYHRADIISDVTLEYPDGTSETLKAEEFTPDYHNGEENIRDYQLVTPWKFNLSAGTTFSNVLALGAEYEYSDYSSAKLKYDDGVDMDDANSVISRDLKGVHTLRIGMEAKLTSEFSMRAGYNYSTAAIKENAYKFLSWNDTRTDTEYNNSKEKNTFTVGLGYRGSVIYADIAYKYDTYKSHFYAFDDYGAEGAYKLNPSKVENNRSQVVFTLGARF